MQARRVMLMAFGENKGQVVRQAAEGPVSEQARGPRCASLAVSEPAVRLIATAPCQPASPACLRGRPGRSKHTCCGRLLAAPSCLQVAASWLQEHPNATAMLDVAAAAALTRMQCPWVLGPICWDGVQTKKAVCWLAQQASGTCRHFASTCMHASAAAIAA